MLQSLPRLRITAFATKWQGYALFFDYTRFYPFMKHEFRRLMFFWRIFAPLSENIDRHCFNNTTIT